MKILKPPLAFAHVGYTPPSVFQHPATCSFSSAEACTFASPCSFNAAPPSACGVFNTSALCGSQWNDTAPCATLVSTGACN